MPGFYLQCEPFLLRFINGPAGDDCPMSTREMLARRDFMRLWWARLARVAASQMLMMAIGWQMYDLPGSA
jgi:hypothetical protein